MPEGTAQMVEAFSKLGSAISVVTLLLVILEGGRRRWWVFGWLYDSMKRDRDEWKALCFQLLGTTDEALMITKKVASASADTSTEKEQ